MQKESENQAPWSRPQTQAMFGLPLSLGVAALMLIKVFAVPFDLPAWVPIAILGVVALLLAGMILLPRRSECPDERDWLIVNRASRAAFAFLTIALLLPFTLRRTISDGLPNWDAELLAMAIAMLGQAIYFAFVLRLYRSGAEG